jgi:multidrug resistance efflux pump
VIKEGQILLQMGAKPFQIQLDQTEAALATFPIIPKLLISQILTHQLHVNTVFDHVAFNDRPYVTDPLG